jgi:hypothetical protein
MPYATMNDICQQGKYKGDTLGAILDKDAAYLYWMHTEKIIKLDSMYLEYCINEKFGDDDIMASEIDIY